MRASGGRTKRVRPVADPGLRPTTVVTAFWLAIATAVSSLVLNGVGVVQYLGRIGELESTEVRQGFTASEVHAMVATAFVAIIVFTIAYSVLLAAFARWMRQGHPRSRVVVTVLCAISLLSIVGFGPGAVTGLLAAFTIVFAWLPVSSDWFRTARGATPRV